MSSTLKWSSRANSAKEAEIRVDETRQEVEKRSKHSPAQLRPSCSEIRLILTSVLSMAFTTAGEDRRQRKRSVSISGSLERAQQRNENQTDPAATVCDRQYLLQLPWIPEIYDCLTAGRFVSTPRSLWGQRFSAMEQEVGLDPGGALGACGTDGAGGAGGAGRASSPGHEQSRPPQTMEDM